MLPLEWRASTSLAGVYALRMLGLFLVLPVLALHAHSLLPEGVDAKYRAGMVGLAMATYGLTQALCQLPLGMLSDKFGRKPIIYIGLLVFAGGSFLAASTHDIHVLIIARAIQGAGAVSAAVTALLADLTREEVRTRAMSMIGLCIGLTFSAGLVISPILVKYIGTNGLFALMGVLTLCCIALVAWFTPNPVRSRLHQDTQAHAGSFSEVLGNLQLQRLNFGIFALQSGLIAMFTTLPVALQKLDWDKTEHWKIYLPATVVGLILMVPAIIVGETRNKLKQVFIGGIILVLAAQLALLGSLNSVWLIAGCLIVYFIGFNILEASMPSLVSKIAPSGLKGTAMGVYNTMQSVGVFAGGMIGGKLSTEYGYAGVYGFCAFLGVVWLMMAVRAPAPLPVKNIVLSIPGSWQEHLELLKQQLSALEGVEDVGFSEDKCTLFAKVRQHGFEEERLHQILNGEHYVIE